MKSTIMQKLYDPIDQIEVCECLVSIISKFNNAELCTHACQTMYDVLKANLLLRDETPFKCFYCIIFYLNGGFTQIGEIIKMFWTPGNYINKMASNQTVVDHASISYAKAAHLIDNAYFSTDIKKKDSDKLTIDTHEGLIKRQSTTPAVTENFDWELFDAIDSVLTYSWVVLNDLEIFQSPEIYSTFIKSFHNNLKQDVLKKILDSMYRLIIDKNHRISSSRYNAPYSKDWIKTFTNMFNMYCTSIAVPDSDIQERLFAITIKLVYHNILLVNSKTLWSSQIATEFDSSQVLSAMSNQNIGSALTFSNEQRKWSIKRQGKQKYQNTFTAESMHFWWPTALICEAIKVQRPTD